MGWKIQKLENIEYKEAILPDREVDLLDANGNVVYVDGVKQTEIKKGGTIKLGYDKTAFDAGEEVDAQLWITETTDGTALVRYQRDKKARR